MKRLLWFLAIIFLAGCGNLSEETMRWGAVSSASPEASRAGMEVLKQGGNAVDAAITISFVLGVTEPAMSGIGGGTQVHLALPGKKSPFAINGSTRSPAMTPISWPKDSLTRHLRSTVPSTVKVMGYLYDQYGSKKVDWYSLVAPAIDYANKGFDMRDFREKVRNKYRRKLEHGMPYTQVYLNDSLNKAGSLAHGLEEIATNGADAFYDGAIAASIDADMRANGGWIRKNDLTSFPDPEELPGVHFSYRGHDIYTQPEPCGGWIVKEILQELEKLTREEPGQSELTRLIEAINYGHQQRKNKATGQLKATSGETTHFSVMDVSGMFVSVTSSINAYYGAGVANPEYGFLYNSYMDDFNFEDLGNQYALGPGKMAYSSMSPTIVKKDGKVVLVIGSPGSARIISTVAQLIHRFTDEGSSPDQLLWIPRVHAMDHKVYFEEQRDTLLFRPGNHEQWEIRRPSEDLVQRGLNAYFGGVHAIVRTKEGYVGLADPRRDGLALAE